MVAPLIASSGAICLSLRAQLFDRHQTMVLVRDRWGGFTLASPKANGSKLRRMTVGSSNQGTAGICSRSLVWIGLTIFSTRRGRRSNLDGEIAPIDGRATLPKLRLRRLLPAPPHRLLVRRSRAPDAVAPRSRARPLSARFSKQVPAPRRDEADSARRRVEFVRGS